MEAEVVVGAVDVLAGLWARQAGALVEVVRAVAAAMVVVEEEMTELEGRVGAAQEEAVTVWEDLEGAAMAVAKRAAEGKAAGCGTPTAQPGRGSWETQRDKWSRTG